MKVDGKYLNHIADRQVNVPGCYNIITIIIREKENKLKFGKRQKKI